MTLYPFETQLVLSDDGTKILLTNAQVTIYDPNDTGFSSPLSLVDAAGVPLSNPVLVTSQGFLPAFQATIPQVMWSGGGYFGYINSYKGLLEQAQATATAATASQTAAQTAASDAEAARIDAEAARIAAESAGGGSGDVSRARIPLNVKDYGAVGNGTNDDTAAIQAALDAVPEGGRAVYLPAGRYKVTSTLRVTRDGTMLYGDGTGNRSGATQASNGSRLEPTSAVTGSVVLVQRTENDRPLQGVVLKDFTIDGALVGTAMDGIVFRCNQGHMDRVHIWRMSGVGLRVKGYASPAWDTYDSTFHNLMVAKCSGVGAILDEDSADTHWSHCIFYGNYDNFEIHGSSGQFTGCHFYDPVRHDIFFNGGGSRTKFANCKIEGLKNHIVMIDSTNGGYSDIQFTGCGFSSQGTADVPTNTYDYVHITGPSSNGIARTTFVGNNFSTKGAAVSYPRYAINLNGSAVQGTVIIANSFGPASHWGTAAIRDGGSSSIPSVIKSNANIADQVATGTPFLNVADFGAKGNGSDDTAAIQAALNAVPASGGTVWMPPGNYKVTAPLIIGADNTTLRGSGAGAKSGSFTGQGTRIQAAIGTAFSGPVVKIARPDNTRAVYAPKLVDLAIDAQGVVDVSSVPVPTLEVTAIRGDFDNVSLWGSGGANLRVVGLSSSVTSTGNRFRSVVASNGGTGILVDDNAADNSFHGCITESNTKGVQLISNRCHFVGCDFNGNTTNVYISDGGTSTRFTACKIRFSSNHGVELVTVAGTVSDVAFVSCSFDGNGGSAANTYDHLNASGPSSNAVSRLALVGCAFVSTATNKPRYGVNLATTAVQNAQLVGNTFGPNSHFGTSQYNNGSNSTLKHQVVGNTNLADIVNGSTVTANYTLAASDANTTVDANSATAVSITVPTNASAAMPVGTVIKITQLGAGQVSVTPAAGVTLNTARTLTTRAQYSVIELRKRSTDTWVVSGDLT